VYREQLVYSIYVVTIQMGQHKKIDDAGSNFLGKPIKLSPECVGLV